MYFNAFIATNWHFLGFGVYTRIYDKAISSFINVCHGICFDWLLYWWNASKIRINRTHNGHIEVNIEHNMCCLCIGFKLKLSMHLILIECELQATWNRKNVHRQLYVPPIDWPSIQSVAAHYIASIILAGKILLIGQYDTSNEIVTVNNTTFYRCCCCCCNVKTRSASDKPEFRFIDSNSIRQTFLTF